MYKLTVYIPQSPNEMVLAQVKSAMFAAGAGNIGNYSDCCWQILGTGQFKPLAGSNPHLGEQGHVETVPEWRVECVVADECIQKVIVALKAAHPYETPAYDVLKIEDLDM